MVEMKNLSRYITEKLDINKIRIDDDKFLIDLPVSTAIEFLKSQGFVSIPYTRRYEAVITGEKRMIEDMNAKSSRVYMTSAEGKFEWVAFADTSKDKISEKNPLFYLDYGQAYHIMYTDSHGFQDFPKDKKEWQKMAQEILKN